MGLTGKRACGAHGGDEKIMQNHGIKRPTPERVVIRKHRSLREISCMHVSWTETNQIRVQLRGFCGNGDGSKVENYHMLRLFYAVSQSVS
jgi:hypothetical protein